MAEPTVGAGYARELMTLATSRGADPARLADLSGIDPADLADQDNRVPFGRYVALMRAAKALTGDPALALHYGEAVDLSEISVVGLIAHAAETMMHAFAQLNRYGRLVVEVEGVGPDDRFQMVRDDEGLWLVDTRTNANDFPELTESTFARMACRSRQFGDTPFVMAVQVTHPAPAHRAEYDRIFQAPVTFDAPRNALRVDVSWSNNKVALMPRYVFGVLSEHAQALLESLEASRSVRGRVESLLLPVLHTGETGIDRIAGQIGVSRQTLFRRLKAEGATFEQVVDALRCRMARHYLTGGKVSVNETAYLVGFSEPAAFSRAFKRWTGMSPRDLRVAAAQGAVGAV